MSERNWQEDWDMCERINGEEWTTLADGCAVWKRGSVVSVIWENERKEALEKTPTALPYWLEKEAEYRVAYELSQRDITKLLGQKRDLIESCNNAQEEIKRLERELAHANCEWQREKSMRYSAIAREGQEKRRADEAEAREQKLKMFIEDLTKIDDGSFPFEAHERWKDIAARYLKQLYGDAA